MVKHFFAAVLKVWSRTPEGPSDCLREWKIKTIFLIILKHHLPFSFSFSAKYTVEFPKIYMACVNVIGLIPNGSCALYSCVSQFVSNAVNIDR